MKKIVRLTESDLVRLVKRVINEQQDTVYPGTNVIRKSGGSGGTPSGKEGNNIVFLFPNDMNLRVDENTNIGDLVNVDTTLTNMGSNYLQLVPQKGFGLNPAVIYKIIQGTVLANSLKKYTNDGNSLRFMNTSDPFYSPQKQRIEK
jgi:hypothetical protein